MLNELYHDMIMDHAQCSPNRFEQVDPCPHTHAYNPLCGDEITLWINIQQDMVYKASFVGQGCAISQASTSLACEAIEGLTVQEALHKVQYMLGAFIGKHDSVLEEGLAALVEIKRFPMRVKCATMAWHACMKLLCGEDRV